MQMCHEKLVLQLDVLEAVLGTRGVSRTLATEDPGATNKHRAHEECRAVEPSGFLGAS